MLLIITAQTKLGLQGHRIRKTAFHTLFNRVTWRIDEIIQKLKHENVTGVRNRKVLLKYTEQSFNVSLVRSSFQLKEFLKGLNLNSQKIGCFGDVSNLTEV